MAARLIVSHPLVEENTNQVAVERGPLVYCMESPDAAVETLDGLFLYSDAEFKAVPMELADRPIVALETKAARLVEADGCAGRPDDARAAGSDVEKKDTPLYRRLRVKGMESIPVRMVPYFAWDNRGYGKMKIWMPVIYCTGSAASDK